MDSDDGASAIDDSLSSIFVVPIRSKPGQAGRSHTQAGGARSTYGSTIAPSGIDDQTVFGVDRGYEADTERESRRSISGGLLRRLAKGTEDERKKAIAAEEAARKDKMQHKTVADTASKQRRADTEKPKGFYLPPIDGKLRRFSEQTSWI